VLSLIWGSSFILIKKSLEHFSPYQVGALRVLDFWGFIVANCDSEQKKFPIKQLKWLLLAAFAGNFIPMFLFPIAETKVSSSIAGIMNSMMPIFTIIVGRCFGKRKPLLNKF
jgi:drug/metabolite transporter (DMT)-like permease